MPGNCTAFAHEELGQLSVPYVKAYLIARAVCNGDKAYVKRLSSVSVPAELTAAEDPHRKSKLNKTTSDVRDSRP